ncbi:MAG: transposase [Bradyrhizobium sp.]|uniref:Transposase n=1 Tax=Bradyrhizobium denitrificans TaxID=2734912 RepID=A0ABS5GCF9_9BRAD|nr:MULTISPECIES: transposase [Bradyrhizobium]MBR1138923.1 transposase [Bradyrhizobium denitrificans]MDU1497851.1 transposase [Bradyrhizobium sp.]MDU1548102.1 transposase [Bradyrhizobium sp.]MDU1669545.1 transposase [Bradyrhizobium sp.]MDU1691763.1 transposase [Bradyrhizobium sp.]
MLRQRSLCCRQSSCLISLARARALAANSRRTASRRHQSCHARRHGRQSAIDDRTTRHAGYGMSQTCRAMVECIFGWGKQHGTMRKTKHSGRERVLGDFLLNLIGYNLIRIPKLIAA